MRRLGARCVEAGELFGEVAFFTEVPQMVGVRAVEVTRVLTITRPAYDGAAAAFPLGARAVLENLRQKANDVRPPLPVFLPPSTATCCT